MECISYRRIKLLEHASKVVQRIFEDRIRQHSYILYAVMIRESKGKGPTHATVIVRHMQEKFTAKGKKLYFGFVNLEKAFDMVPREVRMWAMR